MNLLLRAVNVYQKAGNNIDIIQAHKKIGIIYKENHVYHKALGYFQKALLGEIEIRSYQNHEALLNDLAFCSLQIEEYEITENCYEDLFSACRYG